jgi:putative DNA primase/helicase
VRNATEEYLSEEDAIANWIVECCDVGPICRQRKSQLYASWKEWAESAGEFPGSQKMLTMELEKRGFKPALEGGTGQAIFTGIALKPFNPVQQLNDR